MNLSFDPFWRSSIGFDRVFDMLDNSLRYQVQDDFPHYNIMRTGENTYRLSLAVAGYKPDQISVTVHQNTLIVAGNQRSRDQQEFLHQGIATAAFERRFSLADFMEVKEATLEDGLLQIELVRNIPEEMKPKRIEVRTGKSVQDNTAKTIEHKAA